MPLPPRSFYSVAEAAIRWSAAPFDIIGWAAEHLLGLSTIVPPIRIEHDRCVSGIVGIEAADVLPLFRAHGNAAQCVPIRRIKVDSQPMWITEPSAGVELTAADVLIVRAEVERFERRYGLCGQFDRGSAFNIASPRRGGPGAPPRYDWDAFYGALARRIHDHGIPATQAELVREMVAWFEARDAEHAPDESTIKRKITAVWRELYRA